MDKFLKIQNFQNGLTAFTDWMHTKYAIRIDTLPNIDVKKDLFTTMKEVKDEYINKPNVDLKDLNNIALNKLQDTYVKRLNLSTNVFKNRQVIENPLPIPENTKREEPSKDDPIPPDMFNKMISSYQQDFDTLPRISFESTNPKQLYETPPMQLEATEIETVRDLQPVPQETTFSQETVIEKEIVKTVTERYLVINGHDRDPDSKNYRYKFKVNLLNLSYTFNNITTIQFPKLILPQDYNQCAYLEPQLLESKADNRLAIPYVILYVDEIGEEYDGFNDLSRKTTMCFVYDTLFKCSNGRGYVIMKPAQNEIKVYNQSLASLSHLTISIKKPSGALISMVQDNYGIFKVEYEYYNQLYLKIVVDKYFGKGEFNIGDTVKLSDYKIFLPSMANTSTLRQSDFTDVNEFINRLEGHEVLQLGEPNDNGYYKSFYIYAPNTFDANIGKRIVNKCSTDAIKTYNEYMTPVGNGNIINTSIQPVLYMTIGIEDGKVFRAK